MEHTFQYEPHVLLSPSTISNGSDTIPSVMCDAEPFFPWIKPYILTIVGACVGQAFALYFRFFVNIFGYSGEGKLRHPKATRLIVVIATIQALCISGFYFDIMPTSCIDFLGIKMHYFLWFEWICTVPYLFFLGC